MAAASSGGAPASVTCRWMRVPIAGVQPFARANACSVVLADAVQLMLVGGHASCGLTNTSVINLHDNTNFIVERSGMLADEARVHFSLHTVGDKDKASGKAWSLVALIGNTPSAAHARLPTEAEQCLQMRVLSPNGRVWERIQPVVVGILPTSGASGGGGNGSGDNGLLPSPVARLGMATCAYKSRIFMFGGATSMRHYARQRDAPAALRSPLPVLPDSSSEEVGGVRPEVPVYLNDFMYCSWASASSAETRLRPQVKVFSPAGRLPAPRMFAHMDVVAPSSADPKYSIVMHGGLNADGPLADVHVLDLLAQSWSQPVLAGVPLPVRMKGQLHTAGNVIVIFGGRSSTADAAVEVEGGGAMGGGTSPREGGTSPLPPAATSPSSQCELLQTMTIDMSTTPWTVASHRTDQTAWQAVAGSSLAVAPSPRAGIASALLPQPCALQSKAVDNLSRLLHASLPACGASGAAASGGTTTPGVKRPRPLDASEAVAAIIHASTFFLAFGGEVYTTLPPRPSTSGLPSVRQQLLADLYLLQIVPTAVLAAHGALAPLPPAAVNGGHAQQHEVVGHKEVPPVSPIIATGGSSDSAIDRLLLAAVAASQPAASPPPCAPPPPPPPRSTAPPVTAQGQVGAASSALTVVTTTPADATSLAATLITRLDAWMSGATARAAPPSDATAALQAYVQEDVTRLRTELAELRASNAKLLADVAAANARALAMEERAHAATQRIEQVQAQLLEASVSVGRTQSQLETVRGERDAAVARLAEVSRLVSIPPHTNF